MVLIISNSTFHNGFRLFNLDSSIKLLDKNDWNFKSLSKKLKTASRFRTVHYFWGRANFWEIVLLKLLGKKVILHFIGSDVLMLVRKKSKTIKTKLYSLLGVKILVVHENLKKELADLSIPSTVIEFLNREIIDYPEVQTDKLSVLAYIPEGKENFYNLDIIKEAAVNHSDIDFIIFPNNMEFDQKNITSIPYVQQDKILELMSSHRLFARLPKHDGLPSTLIESLMCSRHAVWTFDHPYVNRARNAAELSQVIEDLKTKTELNVDGKNYVLENYDIESIKDKFAKLWELN